MAFAVLSASTLFVGNFATFDAPCCSLVVVAVALVVTRTGNLSALSAGVAISAAAIFKYTGGAFVPVVTVLALLAERRPRRAITRALIVLTASLLILIDFYVLERGFVG